MKLDFFEVLTRWGLFAAQSSEPNVEGLQRAEERLDFAQLAAACGIGPIENAQGGLLFWNRLSWEDVDEA